MKLSEKMTAKYKQVVLIDFYLIRDYYTAVKHVGALLIRLSNTSMPCIQLTPDNSNFQGISKGSSYRESTVCKVLMYLKGGV